MTDLDEYEGLGAYMINDRMATIKGSIRWSVPETKYYQTDQYVPKPRKKPTAKVLVRRWLEGEEGFSCSQYRYWLSMAKDFLNGLTYSVVEHGDLLVRAFEIYLQKQEEN